VTIGKFPLDHGHPIVEVVHGPADLIKMMKNLGDGDGLIGAWLPQDVCAFAPGGTPPVLL
jgi:hypothetical protein